MGMILVRMLKHAFVILSDEKIMALLTHRQRHPQNTSIFEISQTWFSLLIFNSITTSSVLPRVFANLVK
jgi:hypothetical protein